MTSLLEIMEENNVSEILNREKIIQTLCQHKYDTYVVGGAVRDLVLGIPPKDEDIVTSATPDEIHKMFPTCKTKSVGKSFGVVLVDGIEIATFRSDRYSGLDEKKVQIKYETDIKEDLKRRDFTINAMAFCQYTGDIIDLFGGMEDLRNRTIKFVGDPRERIFEDPNRILRGCRFVAALEGEFHPYTKEALKQYAYLVDEVVDKERIRMEILKAMSIKKASLFFHALHEIGALKFIFPSLEDCYAFSEDEDMHGRFHGESIIEHIYLCGDDLSCKFPVLKLTGYLHDVGKPCSARYEKDKRSMTFKLHDIIGEKIIDKELRNLKFSNEEIHYIKTLTRYHMRGFYTPRSARRLIRILTDNNIHYNSFVRLKKADRVANLKKNKFTKEYIIKIYENIRKAKNIGLLKNVNEIAVDGNDIMKILNIPPSKQVGEVKKELLRIVNDDPKKNDREYLLEILRSKVYI